MQGNTIKQGTTNIVLSGVGGQGVLVASDIIAEVAMNAGCDVKKSEVHGMAQRGGSVVSQVRFGDKIFSPMISPGEGDILMAFEKLEAIRYLDLLKSGGIVIYSTQQITPLTVFSGNVAYPQHIEELCRKKTDKVFPVNVLTCAEKLGNLKVINSIMLGVLSNLLRFDEESWLKIIVTRVPSKTIDLNREAFQEGRKLIDS